jgi:phosphate transport system permease protein
MSLNVLELDRPRGAALQSALKGGQMSRTASWGVVAFLVAVGALLSFVVLNLGLLGAVLITAPIVICGTWGVSRAVDGPRRATDRLMTLLVLTAFAIAIAPLVSVLWTVLQDGLARMDVQFFTSDMRGVIGEGGGALHAIVGTLLITLATAVISVPIGILTAIYLVEYGGGSLARVITMLVDVMTGIPSIVAGLFAFALFELFFGPGVRLGIGGAVALSVMMIPIVVRTTEEMLRLVPDDLREASYALGVPKWRTVVQVVLPAAASGISAGVILAVARIIGETAPLLIIVGATTDLNVNLFSGRMATLPVFTFSSYTQPGFPPEAAKDRAWAAALTLMLIVMILNLLARLIARLLAPKTA